MFQRIGSILKTTPIRSKSAGSLLALQVRRISQEVLDKACRDYPEEIGKGVRAKTFKNGMLTVVCQPLLSAELYTRSDGLIKDINAAIGKNVVEKIRFKSA